MAPIGGSVGIAACITGYYIYIYINYNNHYDSYIYEYAQY